LPGKNGKGDPYQQAFNYPWITHGAFSNPGGQGLVVFIGGYFEGRGDHTYLHPTHTEESYVTAPVFVFVNALTKHADAHAGSRQWLHCFFIKYGALGTF